MKEIPCIGCGKTLKEIELGETFRPVGGDEFVNTFGPGPVCEECMLATLRWGINQWVKAGAPGAKKE